MPDKERYKEIYREASLLRFRLKRLKKRCNWLWGLTVLLIVIPLVLLKLTLTLVQHSVNNPLGISYPVVSILVLYLVVRTAIYLIKLRRRVFNEYRECQETSNALSDMIDWGKMRKRQLYSPLSPELQIVLDGFFTFCLSKRCPFYGGKKIFKNLTLLSLSTIMMVMVGLLLTFIHSILISTGVF